MNYLAHLYLADSSAESRLGNFLGDFVKGLLTSHCDRYCNEILKGIQMHRAIDHFTDRHPIYLNSKSRIREPYRRFAGIVIDISYDHFLSTHWSAYAECSLDQFIADSYILLKQQRSLLPVRLQTALPTLIAQDWLGSNRTTEGVGLTLRRVASRVRRENVLAAAHCEFMDHYRDLEADFLEFFPELIQFAACMKKTQQSDRSAGPVG